MKHCAVNPIKLSQPAGAALAFMGIDGCVPLWHGAQGCTAFAKILFIQHFREPMPFQTTALTHTTVVMGGDGPAHEGMDNISRDAKIIGLLTTGVTETSGADVKRIAKEYMAANPAMPVIPVSVPDYEGTLQTGYVKACEAALSTLARPKTTLRRKQVAVFAGPYITPAEVETIRNIIEDFGLRPVIFPDLGGSLGGYLADEEFTPCALGGTPVDEIANLSNSALVISIGDSMQAIGSTFAVENGIDSAHYKSLATLDELDGLFTLLRDTFEASVPRRYVNQRRKLLDAMLDTQFYFHGKKAALAGDSEFISRWEEPLKSMGIKVIAVSTDSSGAWTKGDLGDLRAMIIEEPVDFLVGNSHMAELADELGLPIVRSGIPVSDRIGEPQTVRMGYDGSAALYVEAANALIAGAHHAEPYISRFRDGL